MAQKQLSDNTELMNDRDPNPTLSNHGARRALNYIIDLAKGRKKAVTFILDPDNEGQIIETHTRKEITVEYRKRNNGD